MLHTNPEVVNPTQVPVGPSPEYFIAYQLVCGLYYYFYNELAFMVLDLLALAAAACLLSDQIRGGFGGFPDLT